MRFTYRHQPTWPCLAWLAECRGNQITVRHGSNVEVHDDWFGECIWDGTYSDGDFDEAEHVFGSGARRRNDQLSFVSSSSVLDRLHWMKVDNKLVISNSLAAVLAATAYCIARRGIHYPRFFRSICDGLDLYQSSLPVGNSSKTVAINYYTNLIWNGTTLEKKDKPFHHRKLECYRDYRNQLGEVMWRLSENWSDAARTTSYKPLGTVSTGYDSTAAAAIGKEAGLKEAISIVRSRSGESDDGSDVAQQLGLTPHRIARDGWRSHRFAEVPFIAGDAKGEDVYFAGAYRLLKQRVLLTGYGGSRVWGLKQNLCEQFQRSDQSGLSHCEARLTYGYLHLPVPFLISKQPASLRDISNAQEMQPWHVAGSYNSPLARRIVEESGVDRTAFGMKKKAASVLLHDRTSFLSEESERDFHEWYGEHFQGCSRLRNMAEHAMYGSVSQSIAIGQVAANVVAERVRVQFLSRLAHSSRLGELAKYQPRFHYLFPWAMEKHVKAYAVV